MPRHRPHTIHDAIELLREEIHERQVALKVLYELVSRYAAEPSPLASTPPPPLEGDPPTPSFTYSERGHTVHAVDDEPGGGAVVVELPKRDAG